MGSNGADGITVNGATVILVQANASFNSRSSGTLAVVLSAGTLDVNNNGAPTMPAPAPRRPHSPSLAGRWTIPARRGQRDWDSHPHPQQRFYVHRHAELESRNRRGLAGDNAGTTRTITTTANVLTIGGIANGTTVNSLTKAGAGTLGISGVSSYTGNTTISAGTLQISAAGQLGSGNYSGNILNNGTLEYSSNAAQTFSGVISGTGPLIKDTNSSILTLGASNTYTGQTTIGLGTLVVSVLGNAGETSSSLGAETGSSRNIILGTNNSNGILTYVGSGSTTDHLIDITNSGGGATINSSGTGKLTLTGGVTGSHSLTLGGTFVGEEDGNISSGGGNINISTSASWILGGTNTGTDNINFTTGAPSRSPGPVHSVPGTIRAPSRSTPPAVSCNTAPAPPRP